MIKRTIDAKKHQAILLAGNKLFLKHGFSGTTMEQIAKQAKVTKQTVYAHFGSKDLLFKEIIISQCQTHAPSESMMRDENLPIEELLFQIGMGFLAMISSPQGLAIHRLVMSEAERKPALAKLFFETGPERMNNLLTRYLDLQKSRGHVFIRNTASAASYFYSLLKGRYHLRMALKIKPLPSKKELEAHVRETVRVFLHIYGGNNPLDTEGGTF